MKSHFDGSFDWIPLIAKPGAKNKHCIRAAAVEITVLHHVHFGTG